MKDLVLAKKILGIQITREKQRGILSRLIYKQKICLVS